MPPAVVVQHGVGPVAQSGRAPPLQGGGPGFKSRRVHECAVPYSIIRCEELREFACQVSYEVKYGCLYLLVCVYHMK